MKKRRSSEAQVNVFNVIGELWRRTNTMFMLKIMGKRSKLMEDHTKLVTDGTFRFKIPAKVPKSYPKQKVDPVMYPEHWRKPDVYEGRV